MIQLISHRWSLERVSKRAVDVVGSAAALIWAPVFAIVASR
jgi:hypothetical protein